MKKKTLTLLVTSLLTLAMAQVIFGADIKAGLIGKFTFDENVTNEMTSKDATTVEKGYNGFIGEETEAQWTYVDGVDGKALYLYAPTEDGGYNTNGLDLGLIPQSYKNYTISFWVKAIGYNRKSPLIFMGKPNQNDSNYISLGTGLKVNYKEGLVVSAYDQNVTKVSFSPADGQGLGVIKNPTYKNTPSSAQVFDWSNVTLVVEDGRGKLYFDGQLVASSGLQSQLHYESMPNVVWDEGASIYLGADAWNDPFNGYIDNLYIYERVLTEEDISALITETNKAGVSLGEFEDFEDYTTKQGLTLEDITTRTSENVYIYINSDFYVSHDQLDMLYSQVKETADKLGINIAIVSRAIINDNFTKNFVKNEYNTYFEKGSDGILLYIYTDFEHEGEVITYYCKAYSSGDVADYVTNGYGTRKLANTLLKTIKLEYDYTATSDYAAVRNFITALERYEEEAKSGLPYTYLNPDRSSLNTLLIVIATVILSTIIGIILLIKLKKKHLKPILIATICIMLLLYIILSFIFI